MEGRERRGWHPALLRQERGLGTRQGSGDVPRAACTQLRGMEGRQQPASRVSQILYIPYIYIYPEPSQDQSPRCFIYHFLGGQVQPRCSRSCTFTSVVNGYNRGHDLALGAVCSCPRAVSCRHSGSGAALLLPFHPAALYGVMPGSGSSWGAAGGDPGWAEGHSHLLSSLMLFSLSCCLVVSSDFAFSQTEIFPPFGK